METKLMKGNEAMAEAAIQAGCDAYFGYPITPQSEVLEYLAREIPNSFYVNQYYNHTNVEAHYHSTGPELWKQTGGLITNYIATVGTGGTI